MVEQLKTERVQILMSAADLKAVDDWAFAQRLRSRGEAIRRLMELGLQAAGKAPHPTTPTKADEVR